jgi:hypothetical protein
VRHLFSHEEMGDRKPTQFLRHLRSLAPDVPDIFLCTIRNSRLPSQVQAILADQTEGSQDITSHLSDRICYVAIQSTTASIFPATPDNTAGLLKIIEFTRKVASLRHHKLATAHIPGTAAAAPRLPFGTQRCLLVSLEFRGPIPKMHPAVLPPTEGASRAERLPPTNEHA